MASTTPTHDDTRPEPAASLARMFYDRIAATPDQEAFRFPDGAGWRSVTWRQTGETVRTLAAGLLALGIRPEERVAILSNTRVEWLEADLAIMCAGAATTTVYPTTSADDVAFILGDSGSRIAFAEDDTQVAKLRSRRDHLPDLIRVVTFDGQADGEWVLSLRDLVALGARHLVEHPGAVDQAVAAIGPEDLATLIYTSGTTGQPKGVELPHRCWTYIGSAADRLGILSAADVQFLWLPLSHSFGKMLEAVQLQIGFPTAVDGRLERIVENLAEVRPTFMAGPPRIFEKVHAKVVQTVEEEGGVKHRLFNWAFRVGDRVARARLEGRRPSTFDAAQHAVADRLVLAKIRERLGGRIRFLVSGSAALSPDVGRWFHAADLLVLEGYGLTETSAGTCMVLPDDAVFGAVGRPLDGTELRIASDGEIFVRGPGVMRGYHHLPEATAEVLSADGWLATGDVGELDHRGRLRITDRKKDLIKTSGGKYIAPQAIEIIFKAVCPLASQMLVHADGRSYATALITLDPDALAQWGRAQGMPVTDYSALAASPEVHGYVAACVEELNGRLNRWETIKQFRILDHDLSVEGGELTPSMKVRRKVIETTYHDLLDSMYVPA
ncbi:MULTISPECIES: long-chain fatty acid--CoA ligase [unclassified Nocardioides]|uniref:AMP-dependent synthetase/ligase n=1 Tax=unclassified Nocardioides TaxID=2615069 RepID=UPI000056F9E5|nr:MULTISPECIES: long-chain fatty acid--CoA ligase [unclassified Nocardioides]ABL82121.1 AMP-dependent synthetase and ligase [Nocardioides sp. JS614]